MNDEAIEIMNTAVNYMDNVKNGLLLVVNSYRGGDYYKGKDYMKDLVEGLLWLNDALTYTKTFHSINTSEINNRFMEMITAFENSDIVMLSDLLEYEILPVIEVWQVKLKKEVRSSAY